MLVTIQKLSQFLCMWRIKLVPTERKDFLMHEKNDYYRIYVVYLRYTTNDSQLLLQEHRTYPDVTIEQRFSSTESSFLFKNVNLNR